MRIRRARDPVVVLATNSPLYAPILLANVETITPTCARMQLELAAYPSSFERAPNDIDPFIDRILSQADVDRRILIGIGDPMRITAVPPDSGHYAQPKVIGGLLHKMCYWLVDHRAYSGSTDSWENEFEWVLVHPRGMTGFTVPCYDYYFRTKNTDLSNFINRLIHDSNPNDERGVYDRLYQKHVQAKPTARPPAFVTMNPLHASEASAFAGKYTLIRSFVEQAHFRDAIMTGVIVARDIATAAEGREAEVLAEFTKGVAQAIEYITHDAAYSAARLWKAFEQNRLEIKTADGVRIPPFFASWGPRVLHEALRMLVKTGALNSDDRLRITAAQWNTTKEMRKVVEPFLTSMERRVAVDALPEDACHVE